MKELINLIYFKDKSKHGNFGDELSLIITKNLLNKDKYSLISNGNANKNIVCIGSYIHYAKNDSYIFGSGVRTENNIEKGHKYKNLQVCAVRGPLTRNFLINKGINVEPIYGDPALLLPKFYKPQIIKNCQDKIGLVPHKSNYDMFLKANLDEKIILINPTDNWKNVIDQIYSCRCIISSSLHGLICADAYNKPNLWLEKYKLNEGDFKFKDYFMSQNRPYFKIQDLNEFTQDKLYSGGNKVDLDKLISVFPFK